MKVYIVTDQEFSRIEAVFSTSEKALEFFLQRMKDYEWKESYDFAWDSKQDLLIWNSGDGDGYQFWSNGDFDAWFDIECHQVD